MSKASQDYISAHGRGRKARTTGIQNTENLTHEQIQEGIRSGRFKEIGLDEKVDLTKHSKFITVPKRKDIDFRTDGIMTEIPVGAYHRLLDSVSSLGNRKVAQLMHKAHHFKIGFEASEHILALASDELVEQAETYLPHPFEDYTLSMWIGSEEGAAEFFIFVHHTPEGMSATGMTLLWGEDDTQTRNIEACVYSQSETPGQRLMWMVINAFRAIMSRPAGRTITQGGPPRAAIRKGKRVHFYSASEIKIDLDAVKRDRIVVGNGFGKMMPVYQYRAHLCHTGGTPGCEHFWIEIGGKMVAGVWEPDQEHPRANATWECYHCGRRRWHRKAGYRGSAEVGYVVQRYRVTKGDDE